MTYRTVDMHTAGEPVRIIVEGYPDLAGSTILEKRRDALTRFDFIRRALILEPRGHAGMYGVIPTAASRPDADFAVLFTHNEGYSTMCGHATIAVGRWAVDSGRVASEAGAAQFRLETPCGVVPVTVAPQPDGPPLVSFDSVRCFASHLDQQVEVPGLGSVGFDIAFGGAYYAILPASRIGLPLSSSPLSILVDAGVRITEAIRGAIAIRHPEEPELGFLYGTILVDDAAPDSVSPSYNLCIFAEGQIDRSPTGSGVCARMALDYACGRIGPGRRREFRGVSGQGFTGEVLRAEGQGTDASVTVQVSGQASYTGTAAFTVEPGDRLGRGFRLPHSFAELEIG